MQLYLINLSDIKSKSKNKNYNRKKIDKSQKKKIKKNI